MRELTFTPSDINSLCSAVQTALQCYAVAQITLTAKGHADLADALGAKITELVILERALRLAGNVEPSMPTQQPTVAPLAKPFSNFVQPGFFGLRKGARP